MTNKRKKRKERMSYESKRKKKMYMKEAGKSNQMKNKAKRIGNEIG
jgi:hypothetical protein